MVGHLPLLSGHEMQSLRLLSARSECVVAIDRRACMLRPSHHDWQGATQLMYEQHTEAENCEAGASDVKGGCMYAGRQRMCCSRRELWGRLELASPAGMNTTKRPATPALPPAASTTRTVRGQRLAAVTQQQQQQQRRRRRRRPPSRLPGRLDAQSQRWASPLEPPRAL